MGDAAPGRASNVNCLGAALADDEQVTRRDPGGGQRRMRQTEDEVIAGVGIARCPAVGNKRVLERGGDEALALDADVLAVRMPGWAIWLTRPSGATA